MKPSAPCGKTEALWCRTTWKAPAAIPPRAMLRIGMASFGTTIFVNGKKAGFFPYNFVPSETDIRPFLRPGAENEIVIRPVQYLLDGSPLTRWESAPGDKKPWVEIDLGEERDVTSCKIHWFRLWKKPPAKWRVTPALPARTRYIFVEISDISPNKLASIEEIEIH